MPSNKHSAFHVFRAIAILPFNVLLTIPFSIWYLSDRLPWHWLSALPEPWRWTFACTFIFCGLWLMYRTISLFSKMGKGTLAPWNPTQKLVVQGPYRYVRNPMISGVLMVLLGETLLLQSFGIFIEALLFFLVSHIYFVLKEEPDLQKRFGESYVEYKLNVPRWVPRLKPWTP